MFKKILVALDHTPADERLLPKIAEMAQLTQAELLLVHVADGWVARNYEKLQLADSEEMKEDRAYLQTTAEKLRKENIHVSTHLAMGDPPNEILKVASLEKCDLIAMTTHGHRLIGDILHGETIERVRHQADIPLFIVNAERA